MCLFRNSSACVILSPHIFESVLVSVTFFQEKPNEITVSPSVSQSIETSEALKVLQSGTKFLLLVVYLGLSPLPVTVANQGL